MLVDVPKASWKNRLLKLFGFTLLIFVTLAAFAVVGAWIKFGSDLPPISIGWAFRRWQHLPAVAHEFEADEISVPCASNIIRQDRPAFQFLAVDRFDGAAAPLEQDRF